MDAKLCVPIVTLSAKENVNLTKHLSDGFEGSVYWKSYQTISVKLLNEGTHIYELLSSSFQGVKRLFVLAYLIAAGAANNEAGIKTIESIFLQEGRLKIIKIYERNFYDWPIDNLLK